MFAAYQSCMYLCDVSLGTDWVDKPTVGEMVFSVILCIICLDLDSVTVLYQAFWLVVKELHCCLSSVKSTMV